MTQEQVPNRPQALPKEKLRYLALEGGGGKGATYLGAIKQLEEYKVLPIQRKPFYLEFDGGRVLRMGSGQLVGVSGSSAGAITALMLALGMNSGSIEYLLRNKSAEFERFCDSPLPGAHRIFLNGKYQLTPDVDNGAFRERLVEKMGNAGPGVSALTAMSFLPLLLPIVLAHFRIKPSQFPLSKIISPEMRIEPAFMKALLVDGGLFIGSYATNFFENLIIKELVKFQKSSDAARDNRNISFKAFKDVTGVDLRITGTNIYTNKPHYFSAVHTPTFPVSLAVSISMNIPVLFKPIIIDSTLVDAKGRATESYKGLWVDGGLLNNLPLHAFDDVSGERVDPKDKDLFPLNENIVALRLTDGRPNASNVAGFNWTRWINLTSISAQFGMLLNTLMYPAEGGQIRTPLEELRTINLYTYDLSMLNFAPSESDSHEPVKQAAIAVQKYFEP